MTLSFMHVCIMVIIGSQLEGLNRCSMFPTGEAFSAEVKKLEDELVAVAQQAEASC